MTIFFLGAVPLLSQERGLLRGDTAMFRTGYDIPVGVVHGTWDFDEWPGVDHAVMYKQNYMYNSFPDEKIKIDYFMSVFDRDDHQGYLRTPAELVEHGFIDLGLEFQPKDAKSKTIVGIFAHPDDEVLLAGGLLSFAAGRGASVKVYLVSNGADGSKGQKDTPSEITGGYNSFGVLADGKTVVKTDVEGENKLAVIEAYAKELGVPVMVLPVSINIDGKLVTQIGEVPGLDFPLTFGPASEYRTALRRAIAEMLEKERPSIIFTHGKDGEYGNYMHKVVRDLTIQAVQEQMPDRSPDVYTCFPEYNFQDRITHFIDLDTDGGIAISRKWAAIRKIGFLFQEGKDFDKPWDPNDKLLDGAFVKDYGYSPEGANPPRYEFFQKVHL